MSFGKRLVIWVATGFGLGYSPVASGTVGSLAGVLLVLAIRPLGLTWQCGLALGMAVLAIPVCGAAEKHFGTKDDGRIVADEYLTFALCTLGLPWYEHWWLLAVAFVVNRVLDIVKPPPASQAQELHGGIGIVLDDVVSSLYALAVNHVIWIIYLRCCGGQ